MSRILADKVTNYNNDGPFEAEKGINIPLARPLQISGDAGISGQYLVSTGVGLTWQTLPELFSGNYADLTNKPVLFSGSYNDLTNKPAILNINLNNPQLNQYLRFNGTQWINGDLPTIYQYNLYSEPAANSAQVVLQDQFTAQTSFLIYGSNGITVATDQDGNIEITSPVVSEYDPDTAKDDISSMFVNGTNTGITYTYNPITRTINSSVSLADQLVYTLYGSSSGVNSTKIYLDNGTTESGSVTLVGTNGIDISWNIGESTITFSKTDPDPYVLPVATSTTLGGVIPDASDFNIDGNGNLTINFPSGGISLSSLSVAPEPAPSGNGNLSYDSGTGQFTYTPPLFSLSDLDNVSIVDPNASQVLQFNGEFWQNSDITSPSNISDLNDVTISNALSGEILQYNGSTWANTSLDISSADVEDLGNVNSRTTNDPGQLLLWGGTSWNPTPAKLENLDVSTQAVAGQVLVWNGTTNLWDPTTFTTGATTLDQLTDVSASGPSDGYVLTWSAENSQWEPAVSGASPGAGLTSRSIVSGTTASLADGAAGNLNINGFKSYMLMEIETNAAAWVTLYCTDATRTADASRLETTDPTPGSGVIAEVITTGAQTVLMTPTVMGFNNDSIPGATIYAKVVNKSGITQAISVSLTILQLEA